MEIEDFMKLLNSPQGKPDPSPGGNSTAPLPAGADTSGVPGPDSAAADSKKGDGGLVSMVMKLLAG